MYASTRCEVFARRKNLGKVVLPLAGFLQGLVRGVSHCTLDKHQTAEERQKTHQAQRKLAKYVELEKQLVVRSVKVRVTVECKNL